MQGLVAWGGLLTNTGPGTAVSRPTAPSAQHSGPLFHVRRPGISALVRENGPAETNRESVTRWSVRVYDELLRSDGLVPTRAKNAYVLVMSLWKGHVSCFQSDTASSSWLASSCHEEIGRKSSDLKSFHGADDGTQP